MQYCIVVVASVDPFSAPLEPLPAPVWDYEDPGAGEDAVAWTESMSGTAISTAVPGIIPTVLCCSRDEGCTA